MNASSRLTEHLQANLMVVLARPRLLHVRSARLVKVRMGEGTVQNLKMFRSKPK